MVKVNEHYLKLKAGYLFPEIARRVNDFTKKNPHANLIRLGIGDVTEPLPAACCLAMKEAIDEIFGEGNQIAVTDPVYPVYVDSNVMSGGTGYADDSGCYEGLIYLPINEENSFAAQIPQKKVDIIYLCFPNNPTGAVATKSQLADWVTYAKENDSLILFDAAYEAFIQDDSLPHSIYEIEGARDCAIEFRSFSKNAGFTGTRCAFTVIPKSLKGKTASNQSIDLWSLWNRRQSTKFNGVNYVVQKGAEAVYSKDGQQQVRSLVQFYMDNAAIIRKNLQSAGYKVFGGENAPYVWLQVKDSMDSWTFFDFLLNQAHIVGTPGSGFGSAGEGYFRLSAFNSRENVQEAMNRISIL